MSAIGDTCHVVPVVRTLQRAFPQAQLTWVIGMIEAQLIGDLDGVEFVIVDKSRGWRGFFDLKKALRNQRFDVLLHMHPSMRANVLSMAIKANRRVGFDHARAREGQRWFVNEQVISATKQHATDAYFCFAQLLGVDEQALCWNIPLSNQHQQFAKNHCRNDKPLVIVHPCSSQRQRNFRNWPTECFARVADHAVSHHDAEIIITGGATDFEQHYANEICCLSSHNPINLVGKTTLKQLLALIEQASVVISPDSAPVHMATAVNTPVIGLYASSNPERTGPYLSQQWTVNKFPEAAEKFLGASENQIRLGRRVHDPSV
ncbi:MAG: glycosyltransferase family 9 protein, partial [Gammaproteobacteria bacterium]|nr:glycosyltransferase family 9 protein [Gammaproteobacteria bacterium]